MVFRAVLSLLSVPGGFTPGESVKHSRRHSRGSGGKSLVYQRQRRDQSPGRGSRGSLSQSALEESTGSVATMAGNSVGGAESSGISTLL